MGVVPQSHFQWERRKVIFLVTRSLLPHTSDLSLHTWRVHGIPAPLFCHSHNTDNPSPRLTFPGYMQTSICELPEHVNHLRKYMDLEFLINSLVQWAGVRIHDLPHERPCLVTRLWFPCREAELDSNTKEKFFLFLLAPFPPSDKPWCSLAVFQQHPDAQLH